MKPDKATKAWMRDASDEYAVSQGCRFDEARGQFAVDWMHDYLRLYEGDAAGQPFECRDWQYDATMRTFGWVYISEDWDGREIRRFRKVIVYIPKKNKKSPTLAAWTIYHAFGDGVQGQKCFPTAKDGRQIRENVGRHIFEMIKQSEELSSECALNQTKCSVYHEKTKSLILPLSSDSVRSQKANEGLNGSVFVDETHVVDKAHMSRISRAGISRPEPLQCEFSTAGDEPESYGFGRFKYAEGVISGAYKDMETLAIIHAAPQDLSPADLLADPMKYIKMANPALGHTVKQGEILHDLEQSKRSPSELATFMMYRLNVWQSSAAPWLSIHDWDGCRSSDEDFDQFQTLTAGLDLSLTTDLSAWLLYDDESRKLRGHYWITRKRLLELSRQYEIPLDQWEADGWVTVCEGRTIDRDSVHKRIEADAEQYTIGGVGYDPYNADDTVKFCEESLSLNMVRVRQNMSGMSPGMKRLKELIIDGELDHSNDPVLRWMVSNTTTKPDDAGNERPLKVDGGVRKHIDGVVAAIMAEAVAQSDDLTGGWMTYESGDAIL